MRCSCYIGLQCVLLLRRLAGASYVQQRVLLPLDCRSSILMAQQLFELAVVTKQAGGKHTRPLRECSVHQ